MRAMDVQEFTQAVGQLSDLDIHLVAAHIESHQGSAADDLEWWQATLTIDRALHHSRRVRMAAMAASSVAKAVLSHTADPNGVPEVDVLRVARAASLVARGLIAGEQAEGSVAYLLRDFKPAFGGTTRSGRASAA